MAQQTTIVGAHLKLYLSGVLYNNVQSVSYTIDYGEQEIYGIDSHFAQEIVTSKVLVTGTVSGVKLTLDGGTQGAMVRSKINEILYSPYTSLRLKDRKSNFEFFFLPQMKVTSESINIQAKGVVTISFSFKGIIPYNDMDIYG
jgi:hypothetical protein